MCVHLTKSGTSCLKNPEKFLCGTHLLHLEHEAPAPGIIDLLERKFDSAKAKAVMDPDRVDYWYFCGNNTAQLDAHGHLTGAKPGRLFNGSDYMGELRRIVGTDYYFIHGRDGEVFDVRDIVSTPKATPGPVSGLTKRHPLRCGNCAKQGVENPYHNSSQEVAACYHESRKAQS